MNRDYEAARIRRFTTDWQKSLDLGWLDINRNYIGSEISKEYCEIAESRLKQEFLL